MHIHEIYSEMQGLVHMLRCPSIDLIQILGYKAESLFVATVMGKVASPML